MSACDDFVAAVEATTGRQGRRVGKSIRLLCPAHDDHNPSLDVTEGDDGRPLAVCRSQGCSWDAIREASGWRDDRAPAESDSRWTPNGTAVAIFDYVDESGVLLFQVRRAAGKRFSQCRPDASSKSGWRFNLKGVRRVLYRLPEVLEAVARGDTVFVCEGEKDVESLRRLGLVATCNPGGAGKWRDEFAEVLRGTSAVVIADRDEPGYRHAQAVAKSLRVAGVPVEVKEPTEGKDITDHLEAGCSLDELTDLLPDVSADDNTDPKSSGSRAHQALALAAGADLFHSETGRAYATFTVHDHRETWPVRSTVFSTWLSSQHYRQHSEVLSASARNDALATIEGVALHEGPQRQVHVRVARHDDAIYLDLADAGWNVVAITATGWKVTADCPVRFVRSAGALPLPMPEVGGSIGLLREYVNVAEDEWTLLVSWLVAALRPQGPYPVLDLLGEQGSAKSTTARVLRALIDPNKAPLRSAPRGDRDLAVTASGSWVVAFDNLSGLQAWLSDAICRLSTGGGFATRQLYTDAEEIILDAQRPVLLTGIVELAVRSDLLDRSLLVTLPSIPETARLPETVFWENFERDRPRILGALLDVVSAALRHHETVQLPTLPRMADFAVWAAAAAPACGWTQERFLHEYENNRRSVHQIAIEDDLVGTALLALGRDGFAGTATELLRDLPDYADEDAPMKRGWPKTARALSGIIRRLAPNLRALGVDVDFRRETTGEKRRLIALTPRREVPVTPVTPVTDRPHTPTGGDADTAGSVTGKVSPASPLGLGDASDASDAPHSTRLFASLDDPLALWSMAEVTDVFRQVWPTDGDVPDIAEQRRMLRGAHELGLTLPSPRRPGT